MARAAAAQAALDNNQGVVAAVAAAAGLEVAGGAADVQLDSAAVQAFINSPEEQETEADLSDAELIYAAVPELQPTEEEDDDVPAEVVSLAAAQQMAASLLNFVNDQPKFSKVEVERVQQLVES